MWTVAPLDWETIQRPLTSHCRQDASSARAGAAENEATRKSIALDAGRMARMPIMHCAPARKQWGSWLRNGWRNSFDCGGEAGRGFLLRASPVPLELGLQLSIATPESSGQAAGWLPCVPGLQDSLPARACRLPFAGNTAPGVPNL